MTMPLRKHRFVLAVTAIIILPAAMGYAAAGVLGDAGPADRKQIAAIAAQRDRALADLADARMRLRITRRVIRRYAEELACVDQLNARLQREAVSDNSPANGAAGQAAGAMR